MSFSLPYGYWLIFPSFIIAAALSWWLYRKNPLKVESSWLRTLLLALRFSLLFFIFFLLLGPLFNLSSKLLKKPRFLVFVDNSASMIGARDSLNVKKDIPLAMSKLREELNDQVELVFYKFDSKLTKNDSLNFTGQASNFSMFIEEAKYEFLNEPGAGVLLVSDGIVNQGPDPLSLLDDIDFPVYTLRTGDTVLYKDAAVSFVKSSELVFEGNNFSIEGAISAFDCANESSTITVLESGLPIASKQIRFSQINEYLPFRFELQAGKEGLHSYEIRIDKIKNERTYLNNSSSVAVQVLKSKQKIKLIYYSAHPDVSAIKSMLSSSSNFELEVSELAQHKFSPNAQTDLYILHQIPGPRAEGLGLIKDIEDKQIPQLFILGSQTGVNYLNNLDLGLSIEGFRQGANEVKPIKNENFSFFHDDNELGFYSKMPPLNAPFGSYKLASGSEILLYQQIGQVKTALPLWFFTGSGFLRKGFIAGDGIWRWKLQEFQQNQNFKSVSSLFLKSIQLLAGREEKGKFRVKPRKRIYNETENIQFDAWCFNDAFEPDNQKDLILDIKPESGNSFQLSFSRTGTAYELDAGQLPAGNYSWKAKFLSGSSDIKEGKFLVKASNIEQINTNANHPLLKTIAKNSGASSFLLEQYNLLAQELRNSPKSKPVLQIESTVLELINSPWILILLLFFASLEWFIRKWLGFI